MLKGRLGLETARIPHADRHGLLWLSRGKLAVRDGTLHFVAAKSDLLEAGDYDIPFQMVSCVLLGPGSTISHDALRLLARHGTGIVAVAEGGVRMYASMPFGPDDSALARRQVELWADAANDRLRVARRMYGWRLGELFPHSDITVLRGIEGARMKETYRRLAEQFGVVWAGRRYDRNNPEAADAPNQAINHAATAVEAAAMVAVAATGALPQLGFIHEDSGISFVLDVADLFRDSLTLPIAFSAVRELQKHPDLTIDRIVRRTAGREFARGQLIPKMIERIKETFGADDGNSHDKCCSPL
jgi:CRISPR-associated protein Cas1